MAVKLRLRRMGRKKRPFYRIVAADARSPRDGRFIEEIGYYNPMTDPHVIEVKEDRALYWLSQGAIPTDTVKSLLRRKGIILKFDLMRRGLPPEKIEEEMKKWEVLQIERRKRLEAKKAQEKKAAAQKAEEAEPAPEEAATAEAEAESATEAPATPESAETETNAASTEETTEEKDEKKEG
ncbi:MAG: 30S ribosomal protein S16 [Calditrichaeota bacterium]|nr:30S ribosomal protein S16 [Calditrichota bacterium]